MLRAQTGGPFSAVDGTELPNAPGGGDQAPQSAPPHGTASISGLVMDINGGLVPEARVTLTAVGHPEERLATSGADGQFIFTDLPPGRYTFTITAAGLETFVSAEVTLKEGERHELPRIALPIASTTSTVTVVVTQEQLATEQVKELEHQRAFGIFPNFYSSYVWGAAPMSSKQKFSLAQHSITDPVGLILIGIVSGIEQARNTFPGYGQEAGGYSKRYGAGYADDAIGRMLGSAILPSVFHQDPRYFYMGTGGKRKRTLHALRSAVVCKGDNGKWQPNYSFVLGSFAAGGISNLYHDAGDRGLGLTFRNGSLNLAGRAADNLIREFVLRRITKVPDYENGKPKELGAQ